MQGSSPDPLCSQCLGNNVPGHVCRNCVAGVDGEQAVSLVTALPDNKESQNKEIVQRNQYWYRIPSARTIFYQSIMESQSGADSASAEQSAAVQELRVRFPLESYMNNDASQDRDNGWPRWPHGLHQSRLLSYSPAENIPPWPCVSLHNEHARLRRDERRARQTLSRARFLATLGSSGSNGSGRLQREIYGRTTSIVRRQPSSSPEDFLMTTDRSTEMEVVTVTRDSSTEMEVVTVTRDRSPVLKEAAYFLGDCPICLEILGIREVAATICGHCFCHECIRRHFKTNLCCPSCRKLLHARHIIPLYLQQKYKIPPISTHE